MKTWIFFGLALMISFAASAQFQFKKSKSLTDAAQNVQWADVNNDSLLDAVITLKKNNYFQLIAISQIATDTAKTHVLADSISSDGQPVFLDWDADNKIDIVFPQTGNVNTLILKNQGNFVFKKISGSIGNTAYSKILFGDLNNDAQPDAVVIKKSGGWSVFKNDKGLFSVVLDSADQVEDLALFDFDGNGFHDFALSGTLQNGQPFLWVYEFFNNFQLARKIMMSNPIHGKIEIGDINEDGFFDLLVSGKDVNNQFVSKVFINNDSIFTAAKKTIGLQSPELRMADFDSDGQADLSFFGLDSHGILRNWISTATNDSIPMSIIHITHQAFGDFDRDGDLDLLLSTDTLSTVILENKTATINQGPTKPLNSLGIFVLNRYFMYWDKSVDDHTPSPALTYDLILNNGQKEIDNGEFDRQNFYRLTVTHGNQGANSFSLLNIPVDAYSYDIQSIDNSFTTHTCHGKSFGSCASVETKVLTTCTDAPIQLHTPQPVMWFSFSKGFLGKSDSMSFKAQTDTVFSFLPNANFSCSNLKIYLIQRSPKDTVKVTKNYIDCKGNSTWLTVDSEWSGVVWKDNKGIQKGTGDSLHYTLTSNETLIAIGHNDHGCIIRETENLKVSMPVLTLNGDDFKIMLGQSVSLSASGAQEYWWQPSEGLSDNISANTVASPAKTTLYTLTGFDSLRCTATATVLVEVTETAFIPTLFTPNGDGKNDDLKIYGLTNANDFQFTIYNREGNIVYETSDIASASASGWNGAKNGSVQQPGVYYWKVDGRFNNGQPLTLNGKTKGSVMLIR